MNAHLLPHDTDAEKGLLCSFLLDPVKVGAWCAEHGVGEDHFYSPAHRLLFLALMGLWTEGKQFDSIVLANRLRADGVLEEAGGMLGLAEITGYVPTIWMSENYIELLNEKRILRALIAEGNHLVQEAYDIGSDPSCLALEASARIGATAGAQTTSRVLSPKELVMAAMDRVQERIEKRGLPDNVLRTGFSKIDDAMSGIRGGDFVLVSGKEKSGKTTLAFNIFENVVFKQGKRGLVISLEMKTPELMDRLAASMGKISLTNILNGWMQEGECSKFTAIMTRISEGKFQLRDDLYGLPQIIAAIRQYKSKHPDLEFVAVDYLQLVDAEKADKDKNREQIIAHTSRSLRRLAGELSVAMVLLVQLNEDGQVRESRAPGMDCTAHIRIEPTKEEGKKWARIVYQRNGPSNVGIPLSHLGSIVRFEPGEFDREEEPNETKRRKRYEQ